MKWYEKQKISKKVQDTVEENPITLKEMQTNRVNNVYEKPMTEKRNEDMEMENDNTYMNQTTAFATADTSISKDACLTGDLKMEGNLKLSGTIIGNINCSGDVRIDGKVEGNITCANAYFDHAEVVGNITCQSYIEILEGTSIQGNIQSSEMQSNGYIVGNVDVHGDIKLSQNAVIEGDVMAQFLESEKGASLKGQCIISAQD